MLKVALRDLLQDFVASEPLYKVHWVYTYLFEVMRYVVRNSIILFGVGGEKKPRIEVSPSLFARDCTYMYVLYRV